MKGKANRGGFGGKGKKGPKEKLDDAMLYDEIDMFHKKGSKKSDLRGLSVRRMVYLGNERNATLSHLEHARKAVSCIHNVPIST